MKCKEAEKVIPIFLKDELDTDDLGEFVHHIEKCEACKEELTIQFLVQEGVARLETGNVFDLRHELDYFIEKANHSLNKRKYLINFLYSIITMDIIALAALITLLFVL